jgi:hypothetical protein
MRRRISPLALALVLACGRESTPPATQIQLEHFSVRLSPPAGWEHLDHGREQLFRFGEVELQLADHSVVTREGLERELIAAKQLWLGGRKRDAFARIRELHGPPLQLLSSDERAHFWRPWTDVTYVAERADSVSVVRALEALIAASRELPDISSMQLVDYVLAQSSDADRREIARSEERAIHGQTWTVVETWDRVSHLYPRRYACLERGGYLLALHTERGLIEQHGPAFEALLASIVVLPAAD